MYVVRVGRNGRITIPIEIRRKLGINPGDLLDVKVEGKRIILRKIAPVDTSSKGDRESNLAGLAVDKPA